LTLLDGYMQLEPCLEKKVASHQTTSGQIVSRDEGPSRENNLMQVSLFLMCEHVFSQGSIVAEDSPEHTCAYMPVDVLSRTTRG
jgi:hypothetical protein